MCRGLKTVGIRMLAMVALSSGVTAGLAGDGLGSNPGGLPRIDPDYTGILIPPNIAPLNFSVREPGVRFGLKIQAPQGPSIEIESRSPAIEIPPAKWRALLEANRGQAMTWVVHTVDAAGAQQVFTPVTNTIARENIDSHLVYRLLNPQYSIYGAGTMGIYQRNLENYTQSTVLKIKEVNWHSGTCLNCHNFALNKPNPMALHIRSDKQGMPMLIARGDEVTTVNRPFGYLSWHPSGKLLAFSINKLSLFFHSIGETRDVFDAASDLGIYRVDENTYEKPAPISEKDLLETWPGWSPDGRYLYYCCAPVRPMEEFREIKYDLRRIAYDPDKNTWGAPEVIVSARDSGLSAGQPKVSPDGRFLIFCLCNYGNFPVYQPSSDLYIMDLATMKHRRMECNSAATDSWHSWSGNSRWLVFSSKRRDGYVSRPHFTYVDPEGRSSKAFILPQENPAFYDSFVKTFNVPELIDGPVQVGWRDLYQAVFHPKHRITPSSNTPGSPTGQPPGELEDARETRSASTPKLIPYSQPARNDH